MENFATEPSRQLSDKSFDSEFPSEVSEEKSVSDMILEKDTKGLSEHMKKGIKNYLQSDQYATFLKAMGKLHNYSPKNIQLLLSQNKMLLSLIMIRSNNSTQILTN